MLDGCVLVDKPAGWTSHDVVARARRLLAERRIGHGGTLDPDATGLLVLGVGRATRLLRFCLDLPKRYVGEIVLGTTTSTLDAAGEVTGRFDMSAVTLDEAQRAAASLTGVIDQVPPMVSALKVGGRRLHELARAGVEVERAPRRVEVTRFALAPTETPGVLSAEVECSSGTYVRSLAADLGAALGGGAHLRALRRLAIGPFDVADAVAPDELSPRAVRPPALLVSHLPRVVLDDDLAVEVGHGRVLERRRLAVNGAGPWALYGAGDELLAVYETRDAQRLKPTVVLAAAAGAARRAEPAPPVRAGAAARPVVVSIGTFDGVHRGHRRLLSEARRVAEDRSGAVVVVTFDRHPAELLRPDSAPRPLSGLAHKLELLEQAGADKVVVLRFDEAQAARSAAAFVEQTLLDELGASAVVVGENFRFGHGGAGNVSVLRELAKRLGFEVIAVPLSAAGGGAVSSTRVRGLIAEGRLEEAGELLERPFELRGSAAEATAGIVALALDPPRAALPPAGTYAVLAGPLDGALVPVTAEVPPSPDEPLVVAASASKPGPWRVVFSPLPGAEATEDAPGATVG